MCKQVNERALRSYIERCIQDACTACDRENDVEYDYRIITNNLLFAIKSRYMKVRVRVEYRLLKNLPKNFGLKFNLVYPCAIHECFECWYESSFITDAGEYTSDINIYSTVGVWNFFGKWHTIGVAGGFFGLIDDLSKYGDQLREHGYDTDADERGLELGWTRFEKAFCAIYGKTPEEYAIEQGHIK